MASSIAATALDSVEPQQELCRFFFSNLCRYGDKCFYSHDQSNTQSNDICRYYLRGKCMYGDRCRYDHRRPKPQSLFSSFEPTTDSFQPDFVTHVPLSFTQVNDEEPISYGDVCHVASEPVEQQTECAHNLTLQSLCPYAEKNGYCETLETERYCPYIHGVNCDLCELPVLHPTDEKQQEEHRLECLKKHEADCEVAFATQRSQDKKCGICLEIVWDREGDKRFGLLENCDHVFCLECIRKWRSSSSYEHKVVKACPECRTKSDFVTPTKYWPENDEAKNKLIEAYKENLQKIHCKFFKRGDGSCPFGSKCFYLHVDKRGQYVQLGSPRRQSNFNIHSDFESLADMFMVSIFSPDDMERFLYEFDYLFNDDDDIESYGSYITDDGDEFRLPTEHDLSDNDEDFPSWH